MIFTAKVSFRLPFKLKRRLERQARRRMLQPADLIREALQQHLVDGKPRRT